MTANLIPETIQIKIEKLLPSHKEDLEQLLDYLILKTKTEPGKRGGLGILKDKIKMKGNFDDPIPGFEPYMP